ncbi:MAG: hypothetical protein JSU72_04120 [Deltaproteobacteria bacterium]|nr:MAG: hypothetical protein JSU72_04120 [Deltaproteobacteria bacterium]
MARRICLIVLVVVLLGCGAYTKPARHLPRDTGQKPEILGFYAAQVIRPGETWKVYLALRDLDCDMTYIVADLWQAGVGSQAISFTPVAKPGCPEVTGYLFLNTPPDQSLIQDYFELKLFVRDRRENRSRSIKLPLSFDWVAAHKTPKYWQAASVQQFGSIQADLISSERSSLGGN